MQVRCPSRGKCGSVAKLLDWLALLLFLALLSVILLSLGLQLLNRRAKNENHNHILALSSLAFFTSLALIKDFLFLPQHCVLLLLGPVKHTINCWGSVWVYQKGLSGFSLRHHKWRNYLSSSRSLFQVAQIKVKVWAL